MIASGAIALVCAGTASATCSNGLYDEALPITASSPADGAAIQQSAATPVSFSLRTPLHNLESVLVEVSTQNIPGQFGTLENDYQADVGIPLNPSFADPDLYTGQSLAIQGWWPDTPGTYYWQIQAINTDPGVPGCYLSYLKSPVYTLTITAPGPSAGTAPPAPPVTAPSPPSVPTPPRLTNSDARSYAVTVIDRWTHHNVPYSTIACTRLNNSTQWCNLAWAYGSYTYRASGKFWHAVGSDGNTYWWYAFRGTRTSLICAMRHPGSHGCTRRFLR
jgi:hypothetical protein